MDYNSGYAPPYAGAYATQTTAQIQTELLRKIYTWMVAGLFVTGATSYVLGSMEITLRPNLYLIMAFGQMGIAMSVQSMRRLSVSAATGLYFLYAGINGLLLSWLFVDTNSYITGTQPYIDFQTIVAAFGATAGTFGFMAVLGLNTKRDLTKMGSYLIMAVWGLILASVISFFADFAALDMIVLYGGLLVFVGLTAYFNWQYKNQAVAIRAAGANVENRFAVIGALQLYISFIAIFVRILQLMNRR